MCTTPKLLASTPIGPADTGDCACPSSTLVMSPSNDILTNTPYEAAPNLYTCRLNNQYRLIFNFDGFGTVILLNRPAQAIFDAFVEPRRLDCLPKLPGIAPGVATTTASRFKELGLLYPVYGSELHPSLRAPRVLTAWLHITNACNLACTYCYVQKNEEAMSEETGIAAVDTVFRCALDNGFQSVKLKYAGGEATLNFSLITMIHERALTLSQRYNIPVQETILSNGVALTKPMLDFIRGEHIRLSISLDGIGPSHDRQRSFINHRGSYHYVERGIDRAIAHGVRPHISITVTAQNALDLGKVVEYVLDRDLPFNLNFVRNYGYVAGSADMRPESNRLITGLRIALAEIEERMPKHRFIDGLLDRAFFHEPHQHACGAGQSYLVIDQHGGVAACQMEIEHTVTDIFADDPLTEIRLQTGSRFESPIGKQDDCRQCAWRHWCAGGCPLLAKLTSDGKSPYCDVFKAIFPELLRLEGLRLLEYGT